MPQLDEQRLGFIDIYHGKAKAGGNSKAPDFEGQLKLSDGTVIRFKTWGELKEGITNNQKFSGYLYKLVEKQPEDKPF